MNTSDEENNSSDHSETDGKDSSETSVMNLEKT